MVEVKSFSLTRLSAGIKSYVTELGWSSKDAIKYRGGQLCKQLVGDSPPSNLGRAQKKAVGYSKNVFTHMRDKSNMPDSKANGSTAWLAVGPNFLLGASRKDLKDQISAEQMQAIYKAKTKSNNFGKAYNDFGSRKAKYGGNQHIIIVNRTVVNKSALKTFRKSITEKFGKMKAAWAVSAIALGAGGSIPAWVSKHIPEMKRKGNLVIPGLLHDNPTIKIIASSTGIEGDLMKKKIKAALISQVEKMKIDVGLYLKGVKKRAGFVAHQ